MAKWLTRFLLFIGIVTVWLTSHPCLSDAHQDKLERHYLHYVFTALTKADLFPDFTVVGVLDDRRISKNSTEVPKWTRLILTEDDGICPFCDYEDWYEHQLHILSKCKHCSELHTFQRIIGCEVEKFPNGTVMSLNVFDEYGFDGEDLIAFDYDTMQWIVKSPKAKEMKKKWDLQKGRNQFIKDYVEKCMEWILTFNDTHKNSPDVYISARKAPHDQHKLLLTCSSTGFYPRDIEMSIRLNESILDNQVCSEIRQNANETFQMNTSVETDQNFKGSYDCFVIHSSLTEPVSVKWDGKCSTFETEYQWSLIVGLGLTVPVLAVILVLALIAICYNGPFESFLALGRNHHRDYGAVSERIAMATR
uniref:Immunoglobulin C1-set domain-containing protein n=1 Tax=Cyprinus carpio carpio TaxID=630221 RepID=A0A9J7XLQ9_CYPCA